MCQAKQIMIQVIAFICFFLVPTGLTKEVYVTSLKVFNKLNISKQEGSKEYPFVSLSDAIYKSEEDDSVNIFISPHEHELGCLNNNLLSACEILRGGAQWKGSKNITIQTFQECKDSQMSSMCFLKENTGTILVKSPELQISLYKDNLVIKDVTIAGDKMLADQNMNLLSIDNQNLIKMIESSLIVQNTIIKSFIIDLEQYSVYQQLEEEEKQNQLDESQKRHFFQIENSLLTIQDSLFVKLQGTIIYSYKSNLIVRNSTFLQNNGSSSLLYCQDSQLQFLNSFAIENIGNSGVIKTHNSNFTSFDSFFTSNQANYAAAAFYSFKSKVTINNCIFTQNKGFTGGAIYMKQSILSL